MRKQTPADSAFLKPTDPIGRQIIHEDYSGSCTRRAVVAYDGHIDICDQVRCRNCPSCLRSRRFLWQMRAEAETLLAHHTWFLTGTWAQQTWDLEECKRETSLFLMRLRSRCHERNTNYRYLVVPERHKSGAFHIHALLHGKDDGLTYKMVADSWQAGFHSIRQCDYQTAGYVTKYVSKDLFEDVDGKRPRIRASRAKYAHRPDGEGPYITLESSYGAWVMEKDKEVIKAMMAQQPKEMLWETWSKNLRMIVHETAAKKKPRPEMKILELMTAN
ncbi:TPA_asm: replication initiator protein [Microviridae sp.]|nr:TPA_asm: replication initiator protein [Microviridae sp.]